MVRKKVEAAGEMLEAPVRFAGFSAGDETARLGFKINRSKTTLAQADQFMCGARLDCLLVLDPNAENDAPGQETMLDPDLQIETVADCKRYSVGTKDFSAGLTFALSEISIADVAALANKSGKIRLVRIGDSGRGSQEDE